MRIALLAVVLVSAVVLAEEPQSLVEQSAVRLRLFSVKGRFELGAHTGISLMPRLTEHTVLGLSGAYNVKELFAVELRAGGAISSNTALAREIQGTAITRTIPSPSDAADLWRLSWHGVVGARFQPIYGKFNLMGELPVHFQVWLWAGGGVAYLERESVAFCATPAGPGCAAFATQTGGSPLVSAALGLRFFLPQGHALKLELRDWSYLDSYRTSTGTRSGVTNLVQLEVGYAFIF